MQNTPTRQDNPATMDDVAAFITARLDEAQAVLDASDADDGYHRFLDADPTTAKVLAEFAGEEQCRRGVVAKRAIIEDLQTAVRELEEAQTREVTTRGTQFWAADAARVERKQVKVTTLHRVATGIATEWSDHPDHRDVWP
jgi:hypothetical protein